MFKLTVNGTLIRYRTSTWKQVGPPLASGLKAAYILGYESQEAIASQ